MRQLSKDEILNLPTVINLYCIGKLNGGIVFSDYKDILITKRDKKWAKKYGEFALLSIKDIEFAEFSEYSLQKDGRLIDDAGDNVWELILYTDKEHI